MSEKLSDRLRRAQEALPALLDESVLMVTAQRLSQDLKDAAQLATLVENLQEADRAERDGKANLWPLMVSKSAARGEAEKALLAFDLGVSQEGSR